MTALRKARRASRRSGREVDFQSRYEGELARLEELDAVAIEEVPAWRIDEALRVGLRPRD